MTSSFRLEDRVVRLAAALLVVLIAGIAGQAPRAAAETAAPPATTQERLDSALIEAIARDDPAEVETLLAAGADPLWRDSGGKTAVHRAAFADNLKLLEVVLAHGADPDVHDLAGSTPMTDALLAASYPLEKIEMLLAAGADPDATNPNGGTPLHTAARTNNGRAILILLEAGASPHATTSTGGTFQRYYFGYPTAILTDGALAARRQVAEWLQQHAIPLEPGVTVE